ncbi:MAG: thiamine pyrophosphate-dependent enzyme [candidate division WOR-3 bacterium]|nr:thiamine pyrophosphate-dependent enzyme [candidate division WOR-3 bacterium]MCX7837570.1 thiamine pyrophosphate-dependent enzyme [candidate division WOR-3 bacterium]MDW8114261.1 thiamine pyrophosphate-dependent enzyme [candidate division WOR-3 bacterium]
MSQKLYKYIREEVFPTPFCPGCGHGILLKTILKAIDELNIDIKKIVFVSGIGCAAWIPSPHFKADTLHTLHGRPLAFATGIRLTRSDLEIMVISGDGDLGAIGGNHLIHTARRNLKIITICANNSIYGMTGGQLSPTTPKECITETSPFGNWEEPFDLCALVKSCGAEFVCRYTVFHTKPLKKAIKKAFQINGFSFIDVISPCPTHYGRRNKMPTLYDFYQFIFKNIISYEKAKNLSKEELKNKIIIGEYV